MKKIFLLLLMACSLVGVSQTEKGRMTFGLTQASFSISKLKDKNYNSSSKTETSFALTPTAGYFVLSNLLLGGSINYNYARNDYENDSFSSINNKLSSIGLGPIIEYYFGNGVNGRPYVSLLSSYGWGKTKTSSDGYSGKGDLTSFIINPSVGYSLFLNDSFMVRFQGGYNFRRDKFTTESLSSDFSESQFILGVGIMATFRK